MAFTANVATDIGKVRLIIMDMDPTKPIFPDDNQIQAFLDLEGGEPKQAAALAFESIAGNRLFVLQVIKLLDLQTDGYSMAKGLLAVAETLRNTPTSDWSGFDIAEQVDNTDFAYREKMWKLWASED